MSELSLRSMERILKKSGAKRVSQEASKELRKILEKESQKIAKKAWKVAKHSKRRTVLKEDILFALEHL